MKNTMKLNKLQAFKYLKKGYNVTLYCSYWERKEKHVFESSVYGCDKRKIAFYHIIDCIKNDFKDISTYYRGNKQDCKFQFVIQENNVKN